MTRSYLTSASEQVAFDMATKDAVEALRAFRLVQSSLQRTLGAHLGVERRESILSGSIAPGVERAKGLLADWASRHRV